MTSEQVIWLLVGIAVVAALVAVAIVVSKRRGTAKTEHRRHEAEQLREDAAAGASGLQANRAEAQEARVEADHAQARASEAERAVAMDEATVEDRVRDADRVDPDVDHTADDYHPEAPSTSTSGAETSSAQPTSTPPTRTPPTSSPPTSTEPTTSHESGDRRHEDPELGGSHRR
jgi:FtsZ-interacting cell division protein ZipA